MSDGQNIETESADFIQGLPIVQTVQPVFVDMEGCGENSDEEHHHPLLVLACTTSEGVTTLVFDLTVNSGAALVDGRMAKEVQNQAEALGFVWQNEVDSD